MCVSWKYSLDMTDKGRKRIKHRKTKTPLSREAAMAPLFVRISSSCPSWTFTLPGLTPRPTAFSQASCTSWPIPLFQVRLRGCCSSHLCLYQIFPLAVLRFPGNCATFWRVVQQLLIFFLCLCQRDVSACWKARSTSLMTTGTQYALHAGTLLDRCLCMDLFWYFMCRHGSE